MPDTEQKQRSKKKTRTGEVTVLQVNNIPWDLFDRISGKAGFLGLDRDEWVREVMERETAEGKELQEKWKREYDSNKPPIIKDVPTGSGSGSNNNS